MAKRILIVDDEENIGRSLRLILEREGYSVLTANSTAAFQQSPRADLYMLDVRLPDGSGIDILRQVIGQQPEAPVLMISGHATIADAVDAVRAGAFDFLEKPLSRERVLLAIRHAFERTELKKENIQLREQLGTGPRMIGNSPAFQRVVEQATLAARADARVLLIGESGTGKELLAAHIHQSSPFASGPFVKVNCAAIPNELIESELFGHEKGAFTGATAMRRGKFELADGGTLFLDEVGDLASASQAKLLRVLQEGEFHRVGGEQSIKVQVRVVSATNKDLQALAQKQQFREDLYYRLAVVPIRMPSLRERVNDIPAMVEYFLDEFCRRNAFKPKTISPAALEALANYHWPGNARELRNIVERMAILTPGDAIDEESVPVEIEIAGISRNSLHEAREGAEREALLKALDDSGWNVSQAARALGLERTNLHKRMKALQLARRK
ncbi:sigma-54-dependent transcriptional regulator [Bryobacter aggregatus]|uniref:sigma-54-dependent transcriptional regulator n=1 Tax=Bryobacter aggregatus TaxID=360054 RepID=UPI0004E0BAB7|nr:sigma-54 dependent transcriptional regulator [Bryobacter aggregatus]